MSRTAQKNDPVLVGIFTGVVLIAIIACIFFAGREIVRQSTHDRAYKDWRESAILNCRLLDENQPPPPGSIPVTETIWQMYTGDYPIVLATVTGATPEEWDEAARYIAIIDEVVAPTGYEYVDEKTGRKLGIRAVEYTFRVQVCDRQAKRIIAQTTIEGSPPPEKIPGSTYAPHGIYGITPFDQVDDWLASLKAQ